MPRDSIKKAVEDAISINKACGTGPKVVMVLRGFVDDNLKTTIKEFSKIMQMAKEEELGGDWPISIDPPLFEQYGITTVPTIVMQGEDGVTARLSGDIRISAVLKMFAEKMKDYGVAATTFDIGERDFKEFLASKKDAFEQYARNKAEDIKKRMYVLSKYDGRFPKVEKERTFLIDPSVVLTEDITDQEGRLMVPKGTRVNPADYATLNRSIVIDGNDPAQVEYALKGDFALIIISSGDGQKLMNEHKRRFYFLDDRAIERFHIEKVPTIFEGEGESVRITEKKL